jgi:hypothetical protein
METYFEMRHEMGSTKYMRFFRIAGNQIATYVLIWTGYCITDNFGIEGMVNYESEATK